MHPENLKKNMSELNITYAKHNPIWNHSDLTEKPSFNWKAKQSELSSHYMKNLIAPRKLKKEYEWIEYYM